MQFLASNFAPWQKLIIFASLFTAALSCNEVVYAVIAQLVEWKLPKL